MLWIWRKIGKWVYKGCKMLIKNNEMLKMRDEMCNLISDYLYNNNFTIKDIETAFDKAKLKLRKEIKVLYEGIK